MRLQMAHMRRPQCCLSGFCSVSKVTMVARVVLQRVARKHTHARTHIEGHTINYNFRVLSCARRNRNMRGYTFDVASSGARASRRFAHPRSTSSAKHFSLASRNREETPAHTRPDLFALTSRAFITELADRQWTMALVSKNDYSRAMCPRNDDRCSCVCRRFLQRSTDSCLTTRSAACRAYRARRTVVKRLTERERTILSLPLISQ